MVAASNREARTLPLGVIIRIGTNDPPSLIDFYDSLVLDLGGSGGVVYLPIPVVDPQARAAIPQADHVLVSLSSEADFLLVHQAMRDYLAADQNRELTLENRTLRVIDTKIAVTAGSLPDEETLRHELFA
jgi:hypothetical protein